MWHKLKHHNIPILTTYRQLTHHGKTKIFGYVFGHIDQLPLGSRDQDEAVQGLKKGFVWQWAVWSLPSRESLKRKEWVQLWLHCVKLSSLSQLSSLILSLRYSKLSPILFENDAGWMKTRRSKILKSDCNWGGKTYPGREQTSWCRCRWQPWSAGRRGAPGPPGWWATERAYSWSHDWCGPAGLWMPLWWICERPWSLRSEVGRKVERLKLGSWSFVYCHTSKNPSEVIPFQVARVEKKQKQMKTKKKVIGLKWSSLSPTSWSGLQGFLWKLLIWEAAVAAAERKALNRLCLCDQYHSGPIHRESGAFIAARASAWASHTKGGPGFCCCLHCLIKWVSSERGAPRHKDTASATKGELHQFVSQHLNNKDPFKLYNW